MPPRLDADERVRRARELLATAEGLIEAQPPKGPEHGAWLVRVRSLIGNADREARRAKAAGAWLDTLAELDRRAESLWQRWLKARK